MTITDQIGHTIELKTPPKRIVSVVPSQTELLHALGLEDEVVGITKFCVHPITWFNHKNRIGGTKTINYEKVNELVPDIILANKEENTKEQIQYLQASYPVYTSNIFSLQDSLAMIADVGKLTGSTERSNLLISEIKQAFNQFVPYPKVNNRVLYLIWKNPYMAAGKQTFIDEMLRLCGFENALVSAERYPELALDLIKNINPDHIFLSSEPYPFSQKHIVELQEHCPCSKITLVDGEYFSWYGSRLAEAPLYFNQLINKIS